MHDEVNEERWTEGYARPKSSARVLPNPLGYKNELVKRLGILEIVVVKVTELAIFLDCSQAIWSNFEGFQDVS